MKVDMNSRDLQILHHIINYCDEVSGTLAYFSGTRDLLETEYVFRNALSKPIEEIGELCGHLSDEFKAVQKDIEWRSIKGMRNIFAHQYGEIDLDVIWNVATVEIPDLKNSCMKIVNGEDRNS